MKDEWSALQSEKLPSVVYCTSNTKVDVVIECGSFNISISHCDHAGW
jgi:hypothetical protein